MGVRGLQTFISKQVPNGTYKINIRNEIHTWKLHNPQSQCLIVIDLNGFSKQANRDKIAQICGGRYKQLQNQFEAFCQTMLDAGAKLAFFLDGPHQKQKDEVWFQRRNATYSSALQIFDGIESGLDLKTIARNVGNANIGSVSIAKTFEGICKRLGYFKTSVEIECDLELAQYAVQNNALAIVGQDSDFMIFEGHWQYWSTEFLDLETLNTICYNRPALCRHLGLSQEQMCLFATLAGNDIIEFDALKDFHRNMGPFYTKFNNLADFVRAASQLPRNLTSSNYESIAYKCFGSSNSRNVDLLRQSIQSYDVSVQLPSNVEKRGYGEISIFTLLSGIPYTMILEYVDRRSEKFKSIADIFIPLIERHVGIVLQQHEKIKCSVIAKLSHQNSYAEMTIQPKYPNVKVDLERLLQKDDTVMDGERFRLLAWQISGDLNGMPGIATLQNGYVVTILTLYYFVKNKVFTIMEADLILSTIYAAKENRIPDEIQYPTHLNSRDLMIGHLYIYLHGLVMKAFTFVGLRKIMEGLIFDGIYYHNLAQKIRNSPRQVYDTAIVPIMDLRKLYANMV